MFVGGVIAVVVVGGGSTLCGGFVVGVLFVLSGCLCWGTTFVGLWDG